MWPHLEMSDGPQTGAEFPVLSLLHQCNTPARRLHAAEHDCRALLKSAAAWTQSGNMK